MQIQVQVISKSWWNRIECMVQWEYHKQQEVIKCQYVNRKNQRIVALVFSSGK
uniref:Uncharacterized protein n=1 Tax=Rhizophora mucronata TaxID=61149 RepID=A0A2P2QQ95_RHIMU